MIAHTRFSAGVCLADYSFIAANSVNNGAYALLVALQPLVLQRFVVKVVADPKGAALRETRATIEEHCPPGVLMSEEQGNGHYGADALSVAIVATVERLSFDGGSLPRNRA